MNNKILSIKSNAIFLATVLVLGTITLLSSLSFMKDAQAQQDYYYGGSGMENTYNNNEYGKDSNYYESSKDSSSKIVKKVNCNNINVNVNGLELNGLTAFLGNLLASEGQDGYGDASSYGSNGYGGQQSGYDNNSFKFICVNNNNNIVIVGGEEPTVPPEPPEPPISECEECFNDFENTAELIAAIVALPDEGSFPLPLGVQINLADLAGVTDAETLCAFLEDFAVGPGFNEAVFAAFIVIILGGDEVVEVAELYDCLIAAGTLPPPP